MAPAPKIMTNSRLNTDSAKPHMTPVIGIALDSFKPSDATRVQSMIDLSKRWLRYKWIICAASASDMLIKKTKTPQGEDDIVLQFQGRLQDFRYREKLEHPLRMQVLLDLFQLIEDFLVIEETAEVAPTPSKTRLFGQRGAKKNNLFSALETYFQKRGDPKESWVVYRNGEPWFGIDPKNERAYIKTMPSSQSLEFDNDDKYEVQVESNVQKVVKSEHVMPMTEWWWHLGIFLSRFGIVPSISGEKHLYYMTLWPDFGRLAHHANHVRIAANIALTPCNSETLAELTGAKPGHISSLINALWLMESLDTSIATEATASVSAKKASVPSIFNKIRAKFKL